MITKIIDFTSCELSSRNLEYGGRAGEKKGILYNGLEIMSEVRKDYYIATFKIRFNQMKKIFKE